MSDGPTFLPPLELRLFVTKAVAVTDLIQLLEMTKQSGIWLFPEGIWILWTFSLELLNLHFSALACVRFVLILLPSFTKKEAAKSWRASVWCGG